MARRRTQQATAAPPPHSILTGVLSFVSREFESFVASATGAREREPEDDYPSSDDNDDDDDDDDEEDHRRRRRRARDHSPPRKRSRRASRSTRRRSPSPPSSSPSPPRKHTKQRSPSPHSADEMPPPPLPPQPDDPAPPPDAPPLSLARILKRRASFTMPGAFSPRSPSMQPEERLPAHVRFTSRLRESPSPSASSAPPPPDSSRQSSEHDAPGGDGGSHHSSPPTTPRRKSAVLAAADKFHVSPGDAGPALLLPSPHHASPRVDKGKARADAEYYEDHVGDTSGMIRVRGKEQELVAAREELDRNERRLDRGHEDDDAGETSMIVQIERARDSDRERIRMLEEEIARLKQELSKRSGPYPPPPPPPPPPFPFPLKNIIPMPAESDDPHLFASARAQLKQAPLPVEKPIVALRRPGIASIGLGMAPDKMAAFLTEMKTVRLRKTGSFPEDHAAKSVDHGGAANATFTAPTPPSRIAQLPPRRSLSLTRPPLGLGLGADVAPSRGDNVSLADWEALREEVHEEADERVRTGDKRKRDEGVYSEEMRGTRKRPTPTNITGTSAHSSFASTVSVSSAQSPPASIPQSSNSSLQSQSTITSLSAKRGEASIRQTPSITSAPTPSLCSDNDPEPEPNHNDYSHMDSYARSLDDDDAHPLTPPLDVGSVSMSYAGPSRAFYRFKGTGEPAAAERSMRGLKRRDVQGEGDMSVGNISLGIVSASAPPGGRGAAGTALQRAIRSRTAPSGIPKLARRAPVPESQERGEYMPQTQSQDERRPHPRSPSPTHTTTGGASTQQRYSGGSTEVNGHTDTRDNHEAEDNADDDDADMHSTSFIHTQESAPPRSNISIFDRRLPSSPLPGRSPRRPRLPSRGSASATRIPSIGRSASSSNGQRPATSTPAAQNARVPIGPPGRTPGVRRKSAAASASQMDGDEHASASTSAPAPTPNSRPSSSSRTRTAPAAAPAPAQSSSPAPATRTRTRAAPLARRLTLDDELRSAVPFLHTTVEDEPSDEEDGGAGAEHHDPGTAYMAAVAQEAHLEEEVHYAQAAGHYERAQALARRALYKNSSPRPAQRAQAPNRVEDHGTGEEGDGDGGAGMENGVLLGVGTRSKRRGFLARGGAGGWPVFMGVGYVQDAEDEDANEEGEGREYRDVHQDYDYSEEHDAAGDGDDDDEYVPSPEPKKRRKSRRS